MREVDRSRRQLIKRKSIMNDFTYLADRLEELEKRNVRLEEQNARLNRKVRRFEVVCGGLLLLGLASCFVGADSQPPIQDSVRAHHFALYDTNDKLRAILAHDGRSQLSTLTFFGENYAKPVRLDVRHGIPEILLWPKNSTNGLFFTVGENGKFYVQTSKEGELRPIEIP
jgi:hypothetical protein